MSLKHMLRDEEESWWLLLEEAEREGEFEMSIQRVNSIQDEAIRAYDNRPAEEAAAWAQVIAQCEIAKQLAYVATQLDSIDSRLEKVYITSDENFDLQDIAKKLMRIANGIESLNPGR